MRLESLFLAFSISSGCPTLENERPSTELDGNTERSLEDVEVFQVPEIDDNPDPQIDDEDEVEPNPIDGLMVYQEFQTINTPRGGTCDLTFETVGINYDDKCNDCVFAFEVQTSQVDDGSGNCNPDAMDNHWLMRAYEANDNQGDYGFENFRLMFRQTVETDDKVLTNVLISVVDYYEYTGNGDTVEIVEETAILAHDDSDMGRAGVTDNRVWWTLDDGVTRIMASGVYGR